MKRENVCVSSVSPSEKSTASSHNSRTSELCIKTSVKMGKVYDFCLNVYFVCMSVGVLWDDLSHYMIDCPSRLRYRVVQIYERAERRYYIVRQDLNWNAPLMGYKRYAYDLCCSTILPIIICICVFAFALWLGLNYEMLRDLMLARNSTQELKTTTEFHIPQ